MKNIAFLLLFLFGGSTAYSDDWLCKSQAGVKRGDSYYVCGIGTAATEAIARAAALRVAQDEYASLSGAKATQEPARTDCEKTTDGFTCYREVIFTPEDDGEHFVKMGKPVQVNSVFMSPGSRDYTYQGSMCASNDYCHIQMRDGRIERVLNVNPDYLK